MSKYFTPITELPGDSGKSQSASSMVQYKPVLNNKFKEKLAPTTKFVEPQKIFPEATNSSVSHSVKFAKRGSKITKINAGEVIEQAIKSVEHAKSLPTGGNALSHFFDSFPIEADKIQIQNDFAHMLHNQDEWDNFLTAIYDKLPKGSKITADEVVKGLLGSLTSGKGTDVRAARSFISSKTRLPPVLTTPVERLFDRPYSASLGTTAPSTTPTYSAGTTVGAPPSPSAPKPYSIKGEEVDDVAPGFWNVGSHIKGVWDDFRPGIIDGKVNQILSNGMDRAASAARREAEKTLKNEYPNISRTDLDNLIHNYINTGGKNNYLTSPTAGMVVVGNTAANKLQDVARSIGQKNAYEITIANSAKRRAQLMRNSKQLVNDAAIIGGGLYGAYNLLSGNKNNNESQTQPMPMQPMPMQPMPMQPMPMQPMPIKPMKSEPIQWNNVSDPRLLGKRMKKGGSVKKSWTDILESAAKAAEQSGEVIHSLDNIGDYKFKNPTDNFGFDPVTLFSNPKPPTSAISPSNATLSDIYTAGIFDGLPDRVRSAMPRIRSEASRAGSAIGSEASRAGSAIGSGASRAGSAIGSGARRAAGAIPSAITSLPPKIKTNAGKFVNAVGVLGGPGVQGFGRGVADVFDSSKGKWLDRMQNAYEDVRGIERPWKTSTVDPVGMYEIPGVPKYEIPYPNLLSSDPDYGWKSYANNFRQTATDPRRVWRRRKIPVLLGAAGALGAGAYYGLNPFSSGNELPLQLQPNEEVRTATGAPALQPTPASQPASNPKTTYSQSSSNGSAQAAEGQAKISGHNITTNDEKLDNLIKAKIQYIKDFQYTNATSEQGDLIWDLLKQNITKLNSKEKVNSFFDNYVPSKLTELQYNRVIKENLKNNPQYAPNPEQTKRTWWEQFNYGDNPLVRNSDGSIDRDATNAFGKSMGNKNKYSNDRSVIQKSMTSSVNKFNSTTSKNKFKGK